MAKKSLDTVLKSPKESLHLCQTGSMTVSGLVFRPLCVCEQVNVDLTCRGLCCFLEQLCRPVCTCARVHVWSCLKGGRMTAEGLTGTRISLACDSFAISMFSLATKKKYGLWCCYFYLLLAFLNLSFSANT